LVEYVEEEDSLHAVSSAEIKLHIALPAVSPQLQCLWRILFAKEVVNIQEIVFRQDGTGITFG
jgi:hypothetical protein